MDTNVTKARSLLQKRLSDIEGEATHIRHALTALNSKPTKKRSSERRKSTRGRRGVTRSAQFVKLVAKHPDGITVADAAKSMKVEPNYLYRVAAQLVNDKQISKDGKTYRSVPTS